LLIPKDGSSMRNLFFISSYRLVNYDSMCLFFFFPSFSLSIVNIFFFCSVVYCYLFFFLLFFLYTYIYIYVFLFPFRKDTNRLSDQSHIYINNQWQQWRRYYINKQQFICISISVFLCFLLTMSTTAQSVKVFSC